MLPDATEQVGSITCSVWRPEPETEGEGRRPLVGRGFTAAIAGLLLGIFALAKGVLYLYSTGQASAAAALSLVLLVLPYALMAGYGIVRRRNALSDAEIPLPAPPEGVPSIAVPVMAGIRVGDRSRGRSRGWLWVDGGWLVFHGDRFDFRLRRSDFRRSGSSRMAGNLLKPGYRWRLQVPAGLSPISLVLNAGYLHEGRFVRAEEARSRFEPLLERWESSDPEPGTPIFPPLRYAQGGAMKGVPAKLWVPIGLLMGTVCAATPYLVGDDRPKQPVGMFLAGFATIALVLGGPTLMIRAAAKAADAEVEKVRRRNGQGLP